LSSQLFGSAGATADDEREWLTGKGPMSPGLLDHLRRQHRSYDVVVFFSLLHPTTADGLAIAPERTILFPYLTLHPALRFAMWPPLVGGIRALGYFSKCERRVARAFLGLELPPDEIVGIGIDPPPQQGYPRHQQDPADDPEVDEDALHVAEDRQGATHLSGRGVPFRRRYRLYEQFAVCGSRVDSDTGCEEMLEYFDAYSSSHRTGCTLALTGVKLMKVPDFPNVRLAGVLPDRERMAAYEAADVTLAPSPDDLLASPVLESLAVGTPVLAAAANAAAAEHCRRSHGGLSYANREEFIEALDLMMADSRLRERLGENGRRYITQHYRWDGVLGRFERLVSRVTR
jgi:glycosyltransferase involved in cell wall biosynthesis